MITDAICAACKQSVRITPDDNLAPHERPLSKLPCVASGLPAREALLGGRICVLTPRSEPWSFRAQRSTSRKGAFLKAPKWLPTWGGKQLPSVALPAKGTVGIWLPRRTSWEQEKLIGNLLPTSRSPEWDGRRGCWTAPNRHFLLLANQLLDRSERVAIGRQYNPSEKCTSSCKNAQLPLCTCSCRGKYHGRGHWMADWKVLKETDTHYQGQSWHWFIAKRAR